MSQPSLSHDPIFPYRNSVKRQPSATQSRQTRGQRVIQQKGYQTAGQPATKRVPSAARPAAIEIPASASSLNVGWNEGWNGSVHLVDQASVRRDIGTARGEYRISLTSTTVLRPIRWRIYPRPRRWVHPGQHEGRWRTSPARLSILPMLPRSGRSGPATRMSSPGGGLFEPKEQTLESIH